MFSFFYVHIGFCALFLLFAQFTMENWFRLCADIFEFLANVSTDIASMCTVGTLSGVTGGEL